MEEGRRKREEGPTRDILREVSRAQESGEAVLVATVIAGPEGN